MLYEVITPPGHIRDGRFGYRLLPQVLEPDGRPGLRENRASLQQKVQDKALRHFRRDKKRPRARLEGRRDPQRGARDGRHGLLLQHFGGPLPATDLGSYNFV